MGRIPRPLTSLGIAEPGRAQLEGCLLGDDRDDCAKHLRHVFHGCAEAVEAVAHEHGSLLVVIPSHENDETIISGMRLLMLHHIDGLQAARVPGPAMDKYAELGGAPWARVGSSGLRVDVGGASVGLSAEQLFDSLELGRGVSGSTEAAVEAAEEKVGLLGGGSEGGGFGEGVNGVFGLAGGVEGEAELLEGEGVARGEAGGGAEVLHGVGELPFLAFEHAEIEVGLGVRQCAGLALPGDGGEVVGGGFVGMSELLLGEAPGCICSGCCGAGGRGSGQRRQRRRRRGRGCTPCARVDTRRGVRLGRARLRNGASVLHRRSL